MKNLEKVKEVEEVEKLEDVKERLTALIEKSIDSTNFLLKLVGYDGLSLFLDEFPSLSFGVTIKEGVVTVNRKQF